MKKTIQMSFLTGMLIALVATLGFGAPISPIDKKQEKEKISYGELSTLLEKENLEQFLGRKPNFAERFLMKRAKKRINKKIRQGKIKADEKPSGLALAALILGSVSIPLLFLSGLGGLTAIAAIITGAIARDKSGSKSDRFGKIGLWLGVATLILLVLLFVIVLAFALSFAAV